MAEGSILSFTNVVEVFWINCCGKSLDTFLGYRWIVFNVILNRGFEMLYVYTQ